TPRCRRPWGRRCRRRRRKRRPAGSARRRRVGAGWPRSRRRGGHGGVPRTAVPARAAGGARASPRAPACRRIRRGTRAPAYRVRRPRHHRGGAQSSVTKGRNTRMARFLDRLGRTAARHKWVTIAIWVLIAVVVVGWGKAAGGKTTDVYTIPGAQSQKAEDLL